MTLVIEVLDSRSGEVRSRHRLADRPLVVGRGYDNDIVLDDPYVDVRHARISENERGEPVMTDLGSVNAIQVADGTRHTTLVLRGDVEVRVGRTRLRFRDADAVLPAALPDRSRFVASGPGPARPGAIRAALGVTIAAMALVAWITWSEDYTTSPASETVNTVLALLLVAAAWAGIWAAAGRIVVHRFRFLEHLALISAFAGVAYLLGVIAGWAAYLFPDESWPDAAGGLLGFVLIAGLVAGHLGLVCALSRRRRWIAALIASTSVFGLAGLMVLSEHEGFSDVPSFSATLKPLAGPWLPTVTIEEFDGVAQDLIDGVDAAAAHGRVGQTAAP